MDSRLPRYAEAGTATVTIAAASAAFDAFSATDTGGEPRALADAALHRAETLIAQGDCTRSIGFLHAAKARSASS